MSTMDKISAGRLSSVAVKVLLTVIFVILVVIIIKPFMAGIKVNAAQRLTKQYLWQDAQQKFKAAMHIDPFDASIPAGFADFLKSISVNSSDENSLLVGSAKLYKRALDLDPFSAEYSLRLAQVELELFIKSQAKDGSLLADALGHFRLALENDPNGFNTSYSVGYAQIPVWDRLNTSEKKLVLDRLRYVISAKPWYGESIYSYLLQVTKDRGLLKNIRPIESGQEIREKINRIKRIKQINPGQLWQGKSKDGNNTYENGNMYWAGTIDVLLNAPGGKNIVKIQARGQAANDIWPYMIVELDGQEIGETFVDNSEWKDYSFPVETSAGLKVLSVTFLNDSGNPQENEDRNLYVVFFHEAK